MSGDVIDRELALYFDCARSFRTLKARSYPTSFRAEILEEIRDELLRLVAYTESDMLRARADALLADINNSAEMPQESVA